MEIYRSLQGTGFYLRRIERYFRCAKFFAVRECRDCHKKHFVIATYCDERFICEICSKKRRLPKLKKRYLPVIRAIMQRPKRRPARGNPRGDKPTLVMITFTEVGDGLIPKAPRTKAHNKAIRKFMHKFAPQSRGYGGLAVNHFQGENGSHLNTHVIAWAPWITREVASKWWEKERGAWNVDIREVKGGIKETANYVLGYVARGATLPKGDELTRFGVRLALNEATRGTRLVHTFGIFYNVQAKYLRARVNPRCPYCESENLKTVLAVCSLGEAEAQGACYIGEAIRAKRGPPQASLFS